MDLNTRELLGLGRDDHWGYGAFALLLTAFLVDRASLVTLLVVVGSGLMVLYIVRSTRRILQSPELSVVVKNVGLLVNAVAILLFVGLAFVRFRRLAG